MSISHLLWTQSGGWRLWQKVRKTHINGKILRVIYNMSYDINSCISLNGSNSLMFASSCGVRQGENLSPILFAIYLKDLEEFLLVSPDLGVTFDCDNEYISIFLKLVVLLYANDTVLIADDANKLQDTLNLFNDYCKQ